MSLVSICFSVIFLSTVSAIHEIPELQDYIVNDAYLSSSSNEICMFLVQGRPIRSLERVNFLVFLKWEGSNVFHLLSF